jgi:hypothetical protein
MLNNYIENQGISKTTIYDNNRPHVNLTDWDAVYDGNRANISINSNSNGKQERFDISLDNEDLESILNFPSVNMSIDKRIRMDFQEPYFKPKPYSKPKPKPYFLELPKPKYRRERQYTPKYINDMHISSPLINEELIIPYSPPPHKHKRAKTHVTHKVYKKIKSGKSKRTHR